MNLIKKIRKKLNKNDLIDNLYKNSERNSLFFNTYWKRPKSSQSVKYLTESCSSKQVGIVLQGPLLLKDNFTLETVKLYKKLYSNCPVIVSTWKGEDTNTLKKIKQNGALVVLSDYPKVQGHERVNYQKYSSLAGIRMAKKLGCKYVLKSRTDQRIYGNNVMQYFKDLVDYFPVKISTKANKRIICCSLSTIKNRLYNISDMLLFGDIGDMELYFDPDDAKNTESGLKLYNEKKEQVRWAQTRPGEIFFSTNYIENCGHKLKWTYEDSDYYRNQLFIVVDAEAIDLFWPKYTRREYMWRSYTGEPFETVGFKDWFIDQLKMKE